MTFREANKEDIPQIQNLMNELNLYRQKTFSSTNKKFHERTKPYPELNPAMLKDSIILLAINEKDKVVGFIQGTIHERHNHKLKNLGYIEELYIAEEARGQGVAQKLLSELESELKIQGCDHLTTHTDAENEAARKFYSKSGMHEATIEFWKKL